MGKSYENMTYMSRSCLGVANWLGNLRWYVKENNEHGKYNFECISALREETHIESVKKRFTAKLFEVQFETNGNETFQYGADFIKTDSFEIIMPFDHYGCILGGKGLRIFSCGEITVSDDFASIKCDGYYICFKSRSGFVACEDGFSAENDTVVAAFNIDSTKAKIDCDYLFEHRAMEIERSKEFWEEYLDSCPVVSYDTDYRFFNDFYRKEYVFNKEDVVLRQLWHWWCVLINVNEVEFNKNPLFIAPDKTNWKGTWSNDALQCIAALALTNQKELTRKLIITYLKSSVSDEGVFSWYTHADGVSCYGVCGDVGRFSNGAPYIPHVVEFYIRNTGDISILDADAGGITVYEKIKKYIHNLIEKRLNKSYGMIEWANLWETGWDDKGGCFFDAASLKEWMKIISSGSDEEIRRFYAEKQRPVLPIVEQVITLWSLYAGVALANRRQDKEFAVYCKDKAELIRNGVSNECWNSKTGFYHDIDVKAGRLTDSKNADVFYWLYFEKDKERCRRIVEHLLSKNEFDCCLIPMLSKDSKDFNESGYWSGGHWPREMSMIGMGLKECGYYEKAKEVVLRAIMIRDGCIIPEVINPISGEMSTPITKMACSIMNILALLHIEDIINWSEAH